MQRGAAHVLADQLRDRPAALLGDVLPGEVEDRVARGRDAPVTLAILVEGLLAAVELPAVQLDAETELRPGEVDLGELVEPFRNDVVPHGLAPGGEPELHGEGLEEAVRGFRLV